jgi:hypothetical protein
MKLSVALSAVALQSAVAAVLQNRAIDVTELEQYWSYERSEPVYPTRKLPLSTLSYNLQSS